MSNEYDQIHILCKEIIPLYDEVQPDVKSVINEHCNACSECKNLLQQTNEMDITLSDYQQNFSENDHKQIPPFYHLVWFKRSILIGLILIRILILVIIGREYFQLINFTDAPNGLLVEGIRASMLIFYLPYSVLSLIFLILVTKKRYILILACIDITTFLFFDNWIAY